ncbi:hypothetical protein EI94DRAFT_1794949 [Lactarius quietus]|nr:hypothetical protein EI94DRAFT_1794949 [Lactarius quietus]
MYAWITGRKRRWPTAARVAEKKRKIEEAIASGGPLPEHLIKRPGLPFNAEAPRTGMGRGGGRGGRGRDADTDEGFAMEQVTVDSASSLDTGSDSDAPEIADGDDDPPRTHVPSQVDPCPGGAASAASPAQLPTVPSASARPKDVTRRAPPPQPKKPPRNPFAARTSLLRSLLLPEIRMTVSNLSQAIHFLVDNVFLENVELVPGQANEKRIEVVSEQPARPEEGSSVIEDTQFDPHFRNPT